MHTAQYGRGRRSYGAFLKRDMKKHWRLYLMFIPVLAFYILFHYVPMYGISIAFTRYNIRKGLLKSTFIGFKNFTDFFKSYYFWRLLGNTLRLNISDLIFAWPTSIYFALLLNEVSNKFFKRAVQTFTYLPHFISTVVVCGIVTSFCSTYGAITNLVVAMGGERYNLLGRKELFTPIYVIVNAWQGMGYGSIIYLAAIAGINQELYEAALIDGAGRLRQTWHVTLPGILPTIMTLLILRIGNIMSVSFEKILLLQNSLNMEVSDVISTFVYRKGLEEANYGYSTAVGLFNSVVSILFLLTANTISRKLTENSLW